SGDNLLRDFGVMGLQIFFQELGGIAFSSGMTDEDDLTCRSDVFSDLLIERILFGHTLATVVGFLSMNQMMMEMIRIVRLHLAFVRRTSSAEIVVDMGGVVVDDNNHAAGLGRLFHLRGRCGFLQEFTQPRNFLHAKVMGLRPLEKRALAADAEHKFISSMRLDITTQILD